jgi:drug/metabolite transporter (DMT)-like permease
VVNARVLTALLAASLGWGLAGVGTRAAFSEGASTFTVVVVRTGIAMIAIVTFALIKGRHIDRRAWRDGALIGVPRIGLAPIFFIASLNYVSAGFEGLLITLIPVLTAGLAHVILKERLRAIQMVGFVLGLAGTTLLIVSGESGIADGSGNTVIGGGLALVGVAFGSISGILARRYSPRHDTATLAVPMFVSGAMVAVVGGLLVRDIDLPGLTANAWQILILLALGSTLLPFVATLYASAHTTAVKVALTGYLAPLVGVILVGRGGRRTPLPATGG